MSFFSQSRKPKTLSSRETKSQTCTDNVKTASAKQTENAVTGSSLFSGMTLTSLPAAAAHEELSLLGHSNSTPSKQLSGATEAAAAITPDFPTVLVKSESDLLPEPILPTPINTPEQGSQSTTKKKRSRHVVRPGYARQPDSKTEDPSGDNQKKASVKSGNSVEEAQVIKQDAVNSETSIQCNDAANSETSACSSVPTTTHQTTLYSIGTPSSSEENLCQDIDSHLDTGSPIALSGEATSKADIFDIDMQAPNHSNDVLKGIVNASTDENPGEITRLDKSFAVLVLQESAGTDGSVELQTLSDMLQNPAEVSDVVLDDYSSLIRDDVQIGDFEREMMNLQSDVESNVNVDQNVVRKLPQSTGDVELSASVETPLLDLTKKSTSEMTKSNYSFSLSCEEKLSIALQSMESKLATLSEGKESLRSLEEELFKLYTETESIENEKEQQIKQLQQKESQALANDNYDEAEEISYRMEQLKADLESSRYRLPAQDDKVGKALKLRAEIAEKEAEIYRDGQATLEEVREEQQECLTNHVEMTTVWSTREKQRLNADRQRLERAKDHLRLDKEHMDAENMELSKEILEQTKEYRARKEELLEERGILQEDILALEAKLAKLKEKEEEFAESIKKEEEKIESIKRAFSPQQNALDKQQQEIEAREKSLQEECELLLSTQKQFDDKTTEHGTKERKLSEVLSSASNELNKSKEVIKSLEEQRQLIQEFLTMEHFTFDIDSKLASLHAKQKEVSQEIKTKSNKIQLGQRGVVTLRKSLNEIEARISDLDAAKEIAKQERNFKEAKRLKEERDSLTEEGVDSQKTLESLLKEIAEDKKWLEKAEQKNNELDSEISEQERLAAVVTLEKASLMIQALQEQISRIPDDSLVKALLETEAITCKNVISDLCKRHDISKPDLDYSQGQGVQRKAKEAASEQKVAGDENVEKNCADLLDQLNELEGRLEAVVEVEDFDEADRIQQQITELKAKIKQKKAVC